MYEEKEEILDSTEEFIHRVQELNLPQEMEEKTIELGIMLHEWMESPEYARMKTTRNSVALPMEIQMGIRELAMAIGGLCGAAAAPAVIVAIVGVLAFYVGYEVGTLVRPYLVEAVEAAIEAVVGGGGSGDPVNNNMGDPNKNPDPAVMAGAISSIGESLKQNGKCDQFARALAQKLEQLGIKYEIIRVDSQTQFIYSIKQGDSISSNGYHYAIRIGNMVYDNLTPMGMRCEEWLADLGANGEFVEITWKIVAEILNH